MAFQSDAGGGYYRVSTMVIRSTERLRRRHDSAREVATMARKDSRPNVSRRKFLTAVAGTAATIPLANEAANAATPPTAAAKVPSVVRPTAHQIAMSEANIGTEVKPDEHRPGSDFMVDVIKSLDIDYVYANPASSYRGIHE